MNENFFKKCRLCGRYGRRFTDIFHSNVLSEETKPNKKLSQLIYRCLQLEVKEDDCLPKKICDDCNKKLVCWQSFHRKCEQTQKKLLQYVQDCEKKSNRHVEDADSSQVHIEKDQVIVKNVPEDKNKEVTEIQHKYEHKTNEENSIKKKTKLGHSKNKHKKAVCDKKIRKKAVIKVSKSLIQGSKGFPNLSKTEKKEKAVDESVVNSSENASKDQNEDKQDLDNTAKEKGNSFQCNICDKVFTHRRKYNIHLASHRNVPQEFQCEQCNKKFCSKFSLRSHLETHSESRNYCCHLCGRLFHTASGLCNHVKLHNEDKRFPCPLCGKQFRQAGHLDQHQRIHTGERPHQCPECAQRFTTRCQMSRHVQGVHRGTKKHKCHMCGKEFLYNNNYKAHMLRHAGQRNNKCGECGKTFVTSNGLFRHRRSHTGDKPFQCNICGQMFADCSNRKRHLLRHLQQPTEIKTKRCGARPKISRVLCVAPAQEQNSAITYTMQLSNSVAALPETGTELVAICSPIDLPSQKKQEISVLQQQTASQPEGQLDCSENNAAQASVSEEGQTPKKDNLANEKNGEEKSKDDVDKPKTYENLRTFLESSEIIETLAGDKGDEALVNIEYVTLLAADGEVNGSEIIQQLIVLPQESQLANYELSSPLTTINTSEEKAESNSLENSGITCILPDDMLVSQEKPNEPVACENLVKVLLAEEKLDNDPAKETTTQNEVMDCSNLIQVLLASDNPGETDSSSKTEQTFLVPPDSFGDEDAIIRMLNSQGTIMLSTRSDSTEFDLTGNSELTTLAPSTDTMQRNTANSEEGELSSDSNFKAFPGVRDAAMCEDMDKKTDIYEHEVSLATSTDEMLVQPATEPMDDIEMFELCAEDELSKLGPMYQVYQDLPCMFESEWVAMTAQ